MTTPVQLKHQRFWKWFRDHESELFDFERDQERLFEELSEELSKIDPDLTFECGPKEEMGPQLEQREFVISAGGIERAFPVVTSLAAAAPQMERWRITAFRPRRPPLTITLGEKRIDPKDVQFSLLDNGEIAGLYLFIPGYRDDDVDLKQIGYLLLDDALGEYDVETNVGLIEMLSPETETDDIERYPLEKLPELFDELAVKLGRPRLS